MGGTFPYILLVFLHLIDLHVYVVYLVHHSLFTVKKLLILSSIFTIKELFHFHRYSNWYIYISTNEEIRIPDQIQPGLDHSLDNQINITHNLFNVILANVQNMEELEESLLAISQDLDLANAQDQNKQHSNNRNP